MPAAALLVVLVVADRSVRQAWRQALANAGIPARSVSRAAEFAKALADGRATHVIASDAPADVALATRAAGRIPVFVHSPRGTLDDVLARLRPAADGAQVTSSA